MIAKWLTRLASFYGVFGICYVGFRYVFHVGHLSAVLAYIDAGITDALYRLEKKLR